MKSLIAHDPRVFWNSSEFGSNPPQLVVTTTQTLRTGNLLTGKTGEDAGAPQVSLRSFPNPFHESNTIQFYLEKPGFINLAVYDMTGKQVAVLVNSNLPAGQHRAMFKPVGTATGIYTIRLVHDRKVITQKLVRE
nr:T9SS type A sorting domain-containing protein [Paraflavitalea speifideiaquila]